MATTGIAGLSSQKILNNFDNTSLVHKHKIKTVTGQTLKNTIDFSKFLTESHSNI